MILLAKQTQAKRIDGPMQDDSLKISTYVFYSVVYIYPMYVYI